ncbi:MAG TPA: hypothetical protein VMR34_05275 [Candidatus Saccharimonadales bacterium]|nr:hypothetical protein [Candidatus Saccharimonadales bacterium]
MKIHKLNQSGVAHYLVAAVAVLAIAAVGTYVMTQTHAATPASVATVPHGWQLIGTVVPPSSGPNKNELGLTFYACESGTTEVKGKAVLPKTPTPPDVTANYDVNMFDASKPNVNNIENTVYGNTYANNIQILKMPLSTKYKNYIAFQEAWALGGKGGPGFDFPAIRASDLIKC